MADPSVTTTRTRATGNLIGIRRRVRAVHLAGAGWAARSEPRDGAIPAIVSAVAQWPGCCWRDIPARISRRSNGCPNPPVMPRWPIAPI
jgi:hypothetical protein